MHPRARTAFVTLLLPILSFAARAQSLEVAPVSVTFPAGQRTAALTITNRGRLSVTIQVRAFSWSEDGAQTLSPTGLLAASPPQADIAPGQAQLIRLLLREVPERQEATYRLLVDQLPSGAATSQVSIVLRLSLPVFSQPEQSIAPALDWRVIIGADGPTLSVRNSGTRHVSVFSAQLRPIAARPIDVRTIGHPYVLAGAGKRWPIGTGADLSRLATVPLHVMTDTGPLDVTARVASVP